MNTVTNNSFREESHRWNWYIPPGATRLFIGTFPTEERNIKHDFFYSSATNRFWDVISKLSDFEIEILKGVNGIEEKKKALAKLNLGLTDMGRKVYRQMGSSKDHSLFPLEFMDIIQLVRDYPSIHTIIVSGESKGNSSLSWFAIFCDLNNVKVDLKELKEKNSTEIQVAGRKLKVCKAYSPSRAARGISDEALFENYKSIVSNT